MLSPEEYHERNHGVAATTPVPPPPFEECRRCQWQAIRCSRKVSYSDPRTAYGVARERNLENNWTPPLRTYQCRFCLNWHLTSRMNRHQAKRAEKHRRKTLR